ncbi:MAG: helix-turn-helix transcriptional regulator [Actinobacteria bacterium]|nr:helix-turn-helix transcriptional regulator [Actinomycetota bacterium]
MIRTFFLGFIRLHIVYHASKEPIFGLDMLRELARHGYELSPGTLYPILHNLEKEGYLVSKSQIVNGKTRKYYQATASGKKALSQAIVKADELMNEIKS